jgi:transposase
MYNLIFIQFLKKNEGKTCIIFLDNFSSHRSYYFTLNAKYKGAKLLFNAPRTPRLNPAETPIKEIRRFLSPQTLENIDEVKNGVVTGYKEFLKYTKCAENWLIKHWYPIN